MAKVNLMIELPIPVETAWSTVGNFNALARWHPAVAKSEESKEDGATLRRLTLHGGGSILERLENTSDTERTYSYSIVESPLPVRGYKAQITVRPGKSPSSSTVEWSSEFEPSGAPEGEAVKVIQGIFEAGLQNLKKMYGK
ncbi:MAG: hypothetical protein QOK29_3277 [Rhodospirillaceae bacterium]|jgi:hypothetical protein|nr:hypothetical protein [Rhodospirillaceae bacterium]